MKYDSLSNTVEQLCPLAYDDQLINYAPLLHVGSVGSGSRGAIADVLTFKLRVQRMCEISRFLSAIAGMRKVRKLLLRPNSHSQSIGNLGLLLCCML
jgi:hypothetical protein